MSFGLDIGSTGIRCLYRAGKSLRGRRAPTSYITLPGGTDQKLLLQRALIPFSACDGSYVVFGNNAVELSRALKLPLIPIFPEGRLATDDPVGRQVAAAVIESVLPVASRPAAPAAMVIPGTSTLAGRQQLLHFAERVIALRGQAVAPLHAGTAAVLADLSDREFTGVGLDVGSSAVSLSVCVHGQPLAELTSDRGCAGVDEVFARSRGRYFFDHEGNRYLDTAAIARWRESTRIDLSSPTGDDQELLRSLVREWLMAVLSDFAQQLEKAATTRVARNVSVMTVTGGPARMPGFDLLVADAFRRAQIPVAITEIRTTAESDYTLARGGLIAAELEQKVALRNAA